MAFSFRTVLAASAAAAGVLAQTPLTMLTDPAARCMDGTLSGYYYEPGTGAGKTKFAIFLNGGGECTTQQACYAQLNTSLGSSKYFAPTAGMPYFLTSDASQNPLFANWSHVNVPYCSQDLHSGQVTQPSNETYGLYFSGHLVLRAVLDALDATAGLKQATEIILTGASAGGIGVFINVDYIADRYPTARVTAVPIAGFYFYAYPYDGVNHTASGLADFRPPAWPQHYALWQSFADETCVSALPATPWACLLANYSFPYVAARTFAVEAQTDQVVLEAHDWLPPQYRGLPPERAYMGAWHANMTQALAPLMDVAAPELGAFNPACYIHTSFDTTSPMIAGSSYLDALGRWYTKTGAPDTYKLADNCGIECNPTCP